MTDSSDYMKCLKCGNEVCLVAQAMEEADLFVCDGEPYHIFCSLCFPDVPTTEEQEDTREVPSTICPICKMTTDYWIIADVSTNSDTKVVLSANGKDLVDADEKHFPKMFKTEKKAKKEMEHMQEKAKDLWNFELIPVTLKGYPLI